MNIIIIINMSGRHLLHSACLFHEIVNNNAPKYLSKKISHRTDVHNINIRFKGTLTPPFFRRSFLYQIAKICNSVQSSIKNKSIT